MLNIYGTFGAISSTIFYKNVWETPIGKLEAMTRSFGELLSQEYYNTEMPLETLAAKIDAALKRARIDGFDQGVAWVEEVHDNRHGKNKVNE